MSTCNNDDESDKPLRAETLLEVLDEVYADPNAAPNPYFGDADNRQAYRAQFVAYLATLGKTVHNGES